MRIACVFIHNIAVQITLAEEPGLHGKPIIIGGLPFEVKPVLDASLEAMSCGVKPGMPLREARSFCPEAVFLTPDEKKYKQAFDRVLHVLDKFSPVIEIEKLGCAYIDVTGVENEQELASELISSVSSGVGLKASAGITNGKFFSLTAAHMSKPGTLRVVPADDEEKFIQTFSIDFLNCRPETKERLRLLGIRLIGQLRNFTSEALVAQFGDEGERVYQLANGVDANPLISKKRDDIISISADVEIPATQVSELLATCQSILEEPFQEIRAQGKVSREVQVQITFDSGNSKVKRLTLKENTSQIKVILARIKAWLESGAFSRPVTQVTLSLWLTSDNGERLSFWSEQNEKGRRLSHMAGELKTRFGYQPLKKVQEIDPDTIVPERRFALTDIPDKR